MLFRALLVAMLLLAGCAGADRSFISEQADEAGKPVEVLELPGIECPLAIAKERNGGCSTPRPMWVVWYGVPNVQEHGRGVVNSRAHELDHVAGLKHGEWQDGCAWILARGRTSWTVGKEICRAPDGTHFER